MDRPATHRHLQNPGRSMEYCATEQGHGRTTLRPSLTMSWRDDDGPRCTVHSNRTVSQKMSTFLFFLITRSKTIRFQRFLEYSIFRKLWHQMFINLPTSIVTGEVVKFPEHIIHQTSQKSGGFWQGYSKIRSGAFWDSVYMSMKWVLLTILIGDSRKVVYLGRTVSVTVA